MKKLRGAQAQKFFDLYVLELPIEHCVKKITGCHKKLTRHHRHSHLLPNNVTDCEIHFCEKYQEQELV